MNRKVNNLKYDLYKLENLGVIPFTLRKDSLIDEEVISWTTSPRFYSDDMKDLTKRINYVFENAKKAGLDEMVMPDQGKDKENCHEITYDEIYEYYKSDIAHKNGTIWNIDKNYNSVFMTRETHFRVLEDFGRSISLVYPAADCAIVRIYDKKKDVIGITHSDINFTTKNIVKDMIEFMKEKFNSNLEDIEVYVGAFAKTGMIWDKYPLFAEEHKEEWGKYIEKIDDNHYNVLYGDKLYDQLLECGLSSDNIYFDNDNTVENNKYFSNNRFKLLGDREGRNLFGITFDSLPVYEQNEERKINTRFR